MIAEQSLITIILYNGAVEGAGDVPGYPEVAASQLVFVTLGYTVEVAVGARVEAGVWNGAFVSWPVSDCPSTNPVTWS